MNTEKFKEIYAESRNGANHFVRHWCVRSFQYSDGVQDLANAGVSWLVDIIATECCKPLRLTGRPMGIIEILVAKDKAKISMTVADDEPPIWHRLINYTDMPDGKWMLYLADEGERFALILPSEW